MKWSDLMIKEKGFDGFVKPLTPRVKRWNIGGVFYYATTTQHIPKYDSNDWIEYIPESK